MTPPPGDSERPIALVTGATSGIGAAFARALAERGYDLMLTGRREQVLEELASDLRARSGVGVEIHIAELTHPADLERLCDTVSERPIHTLINNAGHGAGKAYCDDSYDTHRSMVDVHVLAPLRLISALGPGMITRGRGSIINVASLAGFMSAPRASMYCGTKSFLIHFTESLHMELAPRGVEVQVLCPGFTHTHFHARLGIDTAELPSRGIIRWMSAEKVVETSLLALKRGKVVCIPGFWNRVSRRLAGMVPRRLYYQAAQARTDRRVRK